MTIMEDEILSDNTESLLTELKKDRLGTGRAVDILGAQINDKGTSSII